MISEVHTALVQHFSGRPDIADAMIGPEREDWFNAEAICALGKDAENFGGWWIYGEQSYGGWCASLEAQPDIASGFEKREPDLFCVNRESDKVEMIGEAKLYRRSTDSSPFGSGDQKLVTQLNRARTFGSKLPSMPVVCGIIYGLFNPTNMFTDDGEDDPDTPGLTIRSEFETASPRVFYESLVRQWNRQGSDWSFWGDGMVESPALTSLTPIYSPIASSLELRIGIVLHKDDPLLKG